MERLDLNRLKEMAAKYKPAYLAHECGITRQYLYLILEGRKIPSKDLIGDLAILMGTTSEFLTGESENPSKKVSA